MTTIGKLGITGIRSYGEDEQIIKFSKPLTIILGHNGSGKSTIIEAVKMATTGDLPPMVSQGAAFINDPRITSASETRAKIRLQFTNVRGEEYLVSRHFLLRQVRTGKQEFKTIDQTLKRTTRNVGEAGTGSNSTSHRCAELNALLPDIMRVTKPILNSVIFVHQEDSLWPLGDPKKLKERFDDIFAATRYTKALESIRKFRKEQSADLRVISVELLHHADRAKTCEKLRSEAEDIRTRETKLRAGVQAIQAEMAAIKLELSRAQSINSEYEERQSKLTELNAKISVLEADRDQKFACLAEELSELSDDSLDRLIDDLEDELRRSEGERRDRTVQINATRTELEAMTKSYNDCQSRRGALEAEAKQQGERIGRLEAMKKEFVKTEPHEQERRSPGAEPLPTLESDYALWTMALTAQRSRTQKYVHSLTMQRHQAEDEASKMLNDKQISRSAVELSIKRNKDIAGETRAASAVKREALRGVNGSLDTIAIAVAEEKRCKEQLESVENSDDIAAAAAMYESAKQEYNNLRDEVSDKRQEKSVLVRDHDARAAMQHRREIFNEKESDLILATEGLLEKVKGICTELDINIPTAGREGEKDQIEQQEGAIDLLNRILSRRDRLNADANKNFKTATEENALAVARQTETSKSLIVTESSVAAAEEELRSFKSDLADSDLAALGGDEAIAKLITGMGSGAGVTMTQANCKFVSEAVHAAEVLEKKAARNAGVVSYERVFVGLLLDDFDRSKDSSGRHTCPTCGMSAAKEEKVLAMRNKMLQNLNDKSDPLHEGKVKQALTNAERMLLKLRRLENLGNEIVKLKETHATVVKASTEANNVVLSSKKALEDAVSELNDLAIKYGDSSEVKEAEVMRDEMFHKLQDRDKAKSELRKAMAYLPSGSGARSVSDLEAEIQVVEERIGKVHDVMDQARRELDQSKEDRSLAESRYRNAKDERIQLEQNLEKRRRLEAEKDELSVRLRQVEAEILSDKELLLECEGDLRVAQERYKAVRLETSRLVEAANAEVVAIDKAISAWSSCLSAVELYVSMGKEDALEKLVRHMEKMQAEIERLHSDDQQVTKEAENASDALRLKEAEVRNARDNKKYRAFKTELHMYQAQSRDCRRDIERICEEAAVVASEAIDAVESRRKVGSDASDALKEAGFPDGDSGLISGRGSFRRRAQSARIEPIVLVEELTRQYNEKNAWSHATEGKAQVYTERWALKMTEVKEADRLGSRKKYEECRIKKQTIGLASADLDRYHRALDQALMAYHTLKMDTINKIIKELWQLTYTGTDIDEIEIVSDAGDVGQTSGNTTSVAAAGGSGKRSYNYRVVMRRGDAVLDMRGRCSAGQKVLACLVIRLALAESFCTDCGILALDEPTTNLDRDNVESLAKALRGIIEHRKRQAHFQLILISHDQDFLSMMGARTYCDDFYLIHKDNSGNSIATIQDIRTLED